MGFEAKNAMVAVIAANCVVFLDSVHDESYYNNYRNYYSVNNKTFRSMLISMFTHGDIQHLLLNMYFLYYHGKEVFVATPSRTWRYPLSFLAVYFGSGFGGFLGVSALSTWHGKQWDRKIWNNRQVFAKRSGGFSLFSRPFADAWTYLSNFDGVANNFLFKAVPRIGASGAVFGVMGARVYTSMNDLWHRKMSGMEAASMISRLAIEFMLVPINFDSVNMIDEDKVDHAAHAAGFLTGFAIAAVIQAYSRLGMYRGGRRLGTY